MRYYSNIYTTQGRRRRVAGWGAGRGRAGRGARGPRGARAAGGCRRGRIFPQLDKSIPGCCSYTTICIYRGGRGSVAEMRREPQDMLARPLRPCACALMHRVLLQYMFGTCDLVQWRHLRMGHELRHVYDSTCHRTCRHIYNTPAHTSYPQHI